MKVNVNLLNLKATNKWKLWHDYQAYSKLYFKEHIQGQVESAWNEACQAFRNGTLEEKPTHLSIIQSVTKGTFKLETQDVKDEEKAFQVKWNKAVDDGKEPDVEEFSGESDAKDAEVEDEGVQAEDKHIAVLHPIKCKSHIFIMVTQSDSVLWSG